MVSKKKRDKGYPRFTKEQFKILDSFIGPYGTSHANVISTIVIMWLQEHGHLQPKKVG